MRFQRRSEKKMHQKNSTVENKPKSSVQMVTFEICTSFFIASVWNKSMTENVQKNGHWIIIIMVTKWVILFHFPFTKWCDAPPIFITNLIHCNWMEWNEAENSFGCHHRCVFWLLLFNNKKRNDHLHTNGYQIIVGTKRAREKERKAVKKMS